MRTPEADRCPANDVDADVEPAVHRIPAERRPDPAAAGHRSLGEAYDRLRFAIQPCAVYGLRPEERRHLPQGRGRRIGTLDDASEVDGRQPST